MPATPARRSAAMAGVLAAAAVVLAAAPAGAHAALVGTQPERGATVTEQLDTVVLEFNEPVAFAQVQVTGPGGERVDQGIPAEHGARVEQPLAPVLPQGDYAVVFRVTSDDGHPVDGAFEFAYQGPVSTGDPGDPPAGDGGPPSPPVEGSGEVVEEQAAVDGAGVDPEDARDADFGLPVLIVALVVLAACVAGAFVAVRRRGGGGAAGDQDAHEVPASSDPGT